MPPNKAAPEAKSSLDRPKSGALSPPMVLPFNVAAEIENAIKTAAAKAGFDLATFAPDVRPAMSAVVLAMVTSTTSSAARIPCWLRYTAPSAGTVKFLTMAEF